MTAKKQTPPASGKDPFSIGILTPHFENIPDVVQPMVQFGAKLHSEFLTLWSHRAQAWLACPETFTGCKTAQDVAEAQTTFFTAMQRDYASYFDRVLRDTLIEQDEYTEPEKPAEATEEILEEAAQSTVTHRKAA